MVKAKTPLKYGLVAGSLMVSASIIFFIEDMEFRPGMYFVICLPMLAAVVLTGYGFSKSNDGYVTFKEVFEHSFYTAMISVGMIAAWYVVSFVLFSQRRDDILNEQATHFYDRYGARNETTTKFMSVYIYAVSLFRQLYMTLASGTIFALISAGISITNGRRPEEDNMGF